MFLHRHGLCAPTVTVISSSAALLFGFVVSASWKHRAFRKRYLVCIGMKEERQKSHLSSVNIVGGSSVVVVDDDGGYGGVFFIGFIVFAILSHKIWVPEQVAIAFNHITVRAVVVWVCSKLNFINAKCYSIFSIIFRIRLTGGIRCISQNGWHWLRTR